MTGATVRTAIDAITQQFEREGVKVTRLSVSHAFHSPMMAEAVPEFEAALAAVQVLPPR